jgi:hypothetical protein
MASLTARMPSAPSARSSTRTTGTDPASSGAEQWGRVEPGPMVALRPIRQTAVRVRTESKTFTATVDSTVHHEAVNAT